MDSNSSDHTTEKDRTGTAVDRTSVLLAAIDAAGIPNGTALLDIREESGYLHVLCPADLRALLDGLRLAERVCALVGWTATGHSERDKALTEVWMEWSRSRPGMSTRDAWPDLDDEGIKALAERRDATRAATLDRLFRPGVG